MLALTYHVLLVAALATSFVSIARRIDERLGGAVSAILWGLVAVGSFEIEQTRAVTGNVTQSFDNTTGNVTITQEGGDVVSEASASPEVAFFAAALALVMLIFTLAAATGQLPQRTATRYVSND